MSRPENAKMMLVVTDITTVTPFKTLRALVALAAVAALLGQVVPAAAQQTVTIRGGGWGHGIGMSQYGAYGRALKGASATGILTHYYSGVRVDGEPMPKVRVGLLQYRESISFTSSSGSQDGRVSLKLAGTRGEIAPGDDTTSWTIEPSATGGLKITRDGREVRSDGSAVFGSPDQPLILVYERFGSIVDVAEKPYDYALGKLEFGTQASDRCGSGYCLRLVALLPMQKYLYGLGEVPASWPGAVLKAQAIAGRTYAYNKITRSGQHREPCDCAVFDSTYDQAYIGDAKRTGSGSYWADWKTAVDETNDRVAVYEGDPIQALYSSSSGGYTEHNENVWGGDPLPYLRGVRDRADEVDANPNHTWEITMSFSSFEAKLDAAYGIGSLRRFELLTPFGVSGRVTVVKSDARGGALIEGSRKTVRVSGWSLRSALGLKDTLFRVDMGYQVGARVAARYDSLDAAPGRPRGPEYAVPAGADRSRGRAQDFDQGRLTWRRSSGAVYWQWGRVLQAYDRRGRESGSLGMPRSDVVGPGDWLAASYARGTLVWTKETGSVAVKGAFGRAYDRTGGPAGPMGAPSGRRTQPPTLPNGGIRQAFTGGALYRASGQPVYALWGRVWERYAEIGEAASACGYPTTDAVSDSDSLTAGFEHGTITWTESAGIRVDCG